MSRAPRRSRERDDDSDIIEVDRLADFPHPRETKVLFGHEAAEAHLRSAFDHGQMHHGWLLTGPEGIGKATLAYALARTVLAPSAERVRVPVGRLAGQDESPTARQVRALSHPGLLVIRRQSDGKRTASVIRVDDVRRMKSFLQLTATDGAWRIVIVDPADDLNDNAANALLKSLEEPPPRTVFVLIAAQPDRLLPTIRSRCRRLDLAPLPPHALIAAATQAATASSLDKALPEDGDERMRLMALAQGSVRRLLTLWSGDGLALYERLLKLLTGLPVLDTALLNALAEELSPAAAEERFETFFGLLLDLLPRLVRASVTGRPAIAAEAKLAERLMRPETLASWAELWERIVRDKAVTQALNLDRRSLVLQTGFRMRDTARLAR